VNAASAPERPLREAVVAELLVRIGVVGSERERLRVGGVGF